MQVSMGRNPNLGLNGLPECVCFLLFLFLVLFVLGFFTHMVTSSLPIKSWKFKHILGTHGYWAMRVFRVPHLLWHGTYYIYIINLLIYIYYIWSSPRTLKTTSCSTYDQPKGRRDSGPWLKTMVTHDRKCNKSQENSICKWTFILIQQFFSNFVTAFLAIRLQSSCLHFLYKILYSIW